MKNNYAFVQVNIMKLESAKSVLDYLSKGYKIISAVGVQDVIQYILEYKNE